MSRMIKYQGHRPQCFPRVSGDEPKAWTTCDTVDMFSPRERG